MSSFCGDIDRHAYACHAKRLRCFERRRLQDAACELQRRAHIFSAWLVTQPSRSSTKGSSAVNGDGSFNDTRLSSGLQQSVTKQLYPVTRRFSFTFCFSFFDIRKPFMHSFTLGSSCRLHSGQLVASPSYTVCYW